MQTLYRLTQLATAPAIRDDEGQTMAEYALILTGIAVVVMVAAIALGGAISTTFNNIIGSL